MKIFLDLDGPLLDNRAKYSALHRELLDGLPVQPLDDVNYWNRKRQRISESDILRERGLDEDAIASYLKARQQSIEMSRFLELDRMWFGVHPWLQQASKHHQLFLVTLRKKRSSLKEQLERLSLLRHFDSVLIEEENDGTWEVKSRLIGIVPHSAEDCVVIGDTEVDIQAAKSLGIPSIAVTCGIRTRKLLEECEPTLIVDQLVDLDPVQILKTQEVVAQ